jgi:hypothetical protein
MGFIFDFIFYVILIPHTWEKNLRLFLTALHKTKSGMLESLASCFAFRCSASLNSPQDESAVADMTVPFDDVAC